MEGKETTMADLITKVVQEGQLAADEEDRIWELLAKRKEERLRVKSCRCLADFVTREVGKLMADEILEAKRRTERLFRHCIRETRIANLDMSELSDTEIQKLIILATESVEMSKDDRLLLMTMLQMALNAAGRERGQGINTLKNILHDFKQAENKIKYIKNPYTGGEMQKIIGWLDNNTFDVRGLAVDMWFTGGFTPEEIVGLRKDSLMDADGICISNPTVVRKNVAEDYIALAGRRGRIIRDALKLHGDEDLEYIFMVDDGEGWKKMLDRSIQLKMSFVCRELGITYKPIKCKEALKCDMG